MRMDQINSFGKDFARFVERVFTTESLTFYRVDLAKLMVLLRKAREQNPDEWHAEYNDPISAFCLYLIVKLKYDVRPELKIAPDWLSALAGGFDTGENSRTFQKEAFSDICKEIDPLLKRYGPDARTTIPPQPGDDS